MKHSIEFNQSDKGVVYITIYEVRYRDEKNNQRLYQRYMSEERAKQICKMLHKFEEERYHTAYYVGEPVFL